MTRRTRWTRSWSGGGGRRTRPPPSPSPWTRCVTAALPCRYTPRRLTLGHPCCCLHCKGWTSSHCLYTFRRFSNVHTFGAAF